MRRLVKVAGRAPARPAFAARTGRLNCARAPNSGGTGPLRSFREESSRSSIASIPRSEGIGPVRSFHPSIRVCKPARPPSPGGIEPVSLFPDRSRAVNPATVVSALDEVMVAVPSATAVTSPALLTVATAAALLAQLTTAPAIALPFWSRTSAVNCSVAPNAVSRTVAGPTATAAGRGGSVVGTPAPWPRPRGRRFTTPRTTRWRQQRGCGGGSCRHWPPEASASSREPSTSLSVPSDG